MMNFSHADLSPASSLAPFRAIAASPARFCDAIGLALSFVAFVLSNMAR
ncbi:hypothetical protein [Salmonella enterica]|nr:hypothetical protein [Salmonella enterica]MCP2839666.1 hypothetical protein [Salmonella enterica subsp. enterica serovar Typhimurium]